MPKPQNVRCHRSFATMNEALAYRDGLNGGALEVSQPGTDPWFVRLETDAVSSPEPYHVFLLWGRYDASGEETYD